MTLSLQTAKLKTNVLKKICQAGGTPDMDLFASRISHQLPQYMSWKTDSFSRLQDALNSNLDICFPLFCSDRQGFEKGTTGARFNDNNHNSKGDTNMFRVTLQVC